MHHTQTKQSTKPPARKLSVADNGTAARSREDLLIRRGLPLVDAVARRLWRRWGRRHELDELAAMGRVALVPLVRAYDPRRAPFAPYIVQRLGWAIQDAVRSQTHARSTAVRRAAASAVDGFRVVRPAGARGKPVDPLGDAGDGRAVSRTDAVIGGCCGPVTAWGALAGAVDASRNPEEAVMRKVEMQRLRQAVTQLPGRQRTLVVSHYFHGRRFDHVAARLGISKSWASRLHFRALRTLRKALRRAEGTRDVAPRDDDTWRAAA